MNLEKKLRNLKVLKKDVEIARFSTLQKLVTLNSVTKSHLNVASYAQELVIYASQKWKIETPFYTHKEDQQVKKIWILLTHDLHLFALSYDFAKDLLRRKYNPDYDVLIVVGKSGKKISANLEIEPVLYIEDINDSVSKIPEIVSKIYLAEKYNEISFISNSARTDSGELTILPLDKLNFKMESTTQTLKGYSFYPSIIGAIENLISSYISRLSKAIIRDSIVSEYQQLLFRSNQSLNEIDDQVSIFTHAIRKQKRVKDMQERLISKIN